MEAKEAKETKEEKLVPDVVFKERTITIPKRLGKFEDIFNMFEKPVSIEVKPEDILPPLFEVPRFRRPRDIILTAEAKEETLPRIRIPRRIIPLTESDIENISEDDREEAIEEREEEIGEREEEIASARRDRLEREEGLIEGRIKKQTLSAEQVLAFLVRETPAVDPEIRSPGFNSDILEQVIIANLDPDDGNIRNPQVLQKQLGELLQIGINNALQSNNPKLNVRGVVATFGKKMHQLATDGTFADEKEFSEFVNKEVIQKQVRIDEDQLKNIKFETRFPVGMVFADLFGSDLSVLEQRQLTIDEIREMQREFQRELEFKSTSDPNFDLDLQNLFNWVQEHVVNDQLREVIGADILAKQRDVRIFRKRLPESFSRPGIRFQPSDLGRQTILQEGILTNIKNNIFPQMQNIQERFDGAESGDGNKQRAKNNARTLLNDLNTTFRKHNVIISKPDGTTELLQIKRRKGAQSAPNILEDIGRAINQFSDTTLTFSHIPVKAPGQRIKTEEIIKDIQRVSRPPTARKSKRRKKVHAPIKITKLGKITIHRDSHPSSLREIIIDPETKKEDLLKLAHILQIESGLLMEKDGDGILRIVKGKTKLSDVYHILITEFHKHLGQKTRLLYEPKQAVGGQFLDGFLSPIFRNKKILGGGFSISQLNRTKGRLLDLPISIITHHRQF